jgi:hypothetical protein
MLIGGKTGPRTARRRIPPPEGFVWHECLGYCLTCYRTVRNRVRRGPRRRAWHHGRYLIEDTAELAETGLTGEQIADKLGITWDGLRQAHRRAGVPVPVPKNPNTVHCVSRGRAA